jgi:formylglycine-generating enzyme required for sulfatase activity
MKKYFTLALSFIFVISSSFIYLTDKKQTSYANLERVSKKIRKAYLMGMTFIPMGTYTTHASGMFSATENDTTLLLIDISPKQTSVQAFYLSDHEVTNLEYRAFIRWSKTKMAHEYFVKKDDKYRNAKGEYNQDIPIDWNDSLLQKALFKEENLGYYHNPTFNHDSLMYTVTVNGKSEQIYIYPDTNAWQLGYSYCEPMVLNYFWHPAYDYYPVVGVTWKQAQAYCQWRTDRLNEEVLIDAKVLDSHSDYFSVSEFLSDTNNLEYTQMLFPSFRLPTESEWEYAATGINNPYKNSIYPWNSSELIDEKGKYYANFGPIRDANNVRVKEYVSDGGFHTLITKHYAPNSFGLYDMAGNVAEWQQDAYASEWTIEKVEGLTDEQLKTREDSLLVIFNQVIVFADDDLKTAVSKVNRRLGFSEKEIEELTDKEKKEIEILAMGEIHNAKIAKAQNPARIVKGGSWADSPVYLRITTRTIMNENSVSSRVGFRVAMNYYEN